jgi:hypothetical protein
MDIIVDYFDFEYSLMSIENTDMRLGPTGGKYLLVNSTGIQFFDGETQLTKIAGGDLRIGRTSQEHILITDVGGIEMKDGLINTYAKFGPETTLGNVTSDAHMILNSTSLSLYDEGTKKLVELNTDVLFLGDQTKAHQEITAEDTIFYDDDGVTKRVWIDNDASINLYDKDGVSKFTADHSYVRIGESNRGRIHLTNNDIYMYDGADPPVARVRLDNAGTLTLGQSDEARTEITDSHIYMYDGAVTPAVRVTLDSSGNLQLGKTGEASTVITDSSISMYSGQVTPYKKVYINSAGVIALGGKVDADVSASSTDDVIRMTPGSGVSIYEDDEHFTSITSTGMEVYAGDDTNPVAVFGSDVYVGLQASEHIKISGGEVLVNDGGVNLMTIADGDIEMNGKITLQSVFDNVCVGTANNDIGTSNVSIGSFCLQYGSASTYNNVAMGYKAGQHMGTLHAGSSTCTNNVFIGYHAGINAKTTLSNVAIGKGAGHSLVDGNNNVLLGYDAGGSLVGNGGPGELGSENIVLGSEAASTLVSGSANVCIGYNADVMSEDTHVEIAIGYNCVGGGLGTATLGGPNHNQIYMNSEKNAQVFAGSLSLNEESYNYAVYAGDSIGHIDFTANDESSGSIANEPGAAIWAEAEGTFYSDANPTSLCIGTASAGSAFEQDAQHSVTSEQEHFRVRSNGQVSMKNLRINHHTTADMGQDDYEDIPLESGANFIIVRNEGHGRALYMCTCWSDSVTQVVEIVGNGAFHLGSGTVGGGPTGEKVIRLTVDAVAGPYKHNLIIFNVIEWN